MTLEEMLADYDFPLEESRIAKFPASKRDESKLLVVERKSGEIREHAHFLEIASYLVPGDVLVFNETKVSKRRVFLSARSGRIHESVFLESRDPEGKEWACILKNRKKLKLGDILFPDHFPDVKIAYVGGEGDLSLVRFERIISEADFDLWGNIPIPPYLKRTATKEDEERYQTIFAKHLGSVAAPTAGLHFTEELRNKLQKNNIQFVPVQLQIGYGTFQPLNESQWLGKKLHKEFYAVPDSSAKALNDARREGRRVIAIGTTTLRVLESVFERETQLFVAGHGATDIFMSPGDALPSIQGLITNFHLPRSSLLLLVSTFAGKELIMKAYHHALDQNFRFYSYGDAMFLI
jgi:S-adenosylmethionine:tRNA ribosyltransferase-isomerase